MPDTTPPTLAISSDKSALKIGETATITFTFSEDPGATFTAADVTAIDGGLSHFTATADPLVYTATYTPRADLASANGVIKVAAGAYADLAGNAGGAASSPAIRIDTLAPTSSNATVSFSADSGASSNDLVTNTASQTISGTLHAPLGLGEVVQVSLDNGVNWTDASSTGPSSWTLGTTLSGANTLQVRVADAAGNVGPVTSAAYALDMAPPTVTISSDVAVVNAAGATITFTFSEPPVGFSSSDLSASEGTLGPLLVGSTPLTYTATFTPTAGVNAGTATIAVGGGYSDAAGNGGTPGALPSLLVDSVAPVASAASVIFSSDTGVGSSDLVTKTAPQTLSGLLSAPLAAGDVVQVSLDNGATWTNAPTSPGDTSWALGATLSGSNTLQVRVADAAGNTSTPLAAAYVLDETAPTVAITSHVSALKADETATISFTFSEDPGASFTVDDVNVTGGTLGALSGSGLIRTAVFTPTANLDSSTASITVTGGSYADFAGNLGVGGALSLPFDTRAPSAPSAPDLAAASDSGASATDNITADVTPTFTGTAEAHAIVTLYDTDGTTVLGTATADASGAWSITSSTLSLGDHTLTATAIDPAGNLSAAGPGLTVTIASPPPITPPRPSGVVTEILPGGARVTGDPLGNLITSSGGADTVWGGAGRDTVIGGIGDDVLQGNQDNDSIVAGGGADVVHGGQGDDFLQGSTGLDLLFGDKGADTVHGGQGADTIQGGEGDDLVLGDLGDDVLRGGQGNDYIVGGLGDDLLSGDLGTNALTGGAGADSFHSSGAGHDVVTDFNRSEGDRILLAPGTRYTVSQVGDDVHIDFAVGGDLVLQGCKLADLTGSWIVD